MHENCCFFVCLFDHKKVEIESKMRAPGMTISVFFILLEKLISIDRSEQVRESIEQCNKEMDEAMIVALDKNINDVDLEKTGVRCDEDTFIDVTDSPDKNTTMVFL